MRASLGCSSWVDLWPSLGSVWPAVTTRSAQRERAEEPRYVVWLPEPGDWPLPPAVPGLVTSGGHRIMHEIAAAIAATGRPVEMRGRVSVADLEAISDAADVAMPELPTERRRATSRDVLLVPEGKPAITFAQIALSRARLILLVLAPPGLFGWSFSDGWSHPNPLDVDIESVARPEHFRAMAAMGFELWTHSPVLLERIKGAGLTGTLTGTGTPVPFPEPLRKRYDVVTLADNRWADLARSVVSQLSPDVVHHEVPRSSHEDVLGAFGQAKILVHPLRVEGHSNIGQEARAMGAVPVVLDTNPFSVGLDDAGGAVAVPTLDDMAAAVTSLLADSRRLELLRDRAMRTAREQLDWERFVARIESAVSSPPPDDSARAARGVMGDELMGRERVLHGQISELRAEVEQLKRERGELAADRDVVRTRLDALQSTRWWWLARTYRRLRDRLRRRE